MPKLKNYEYYNINGCEVRGYDRSDGKYFCGDDLCYALGYPDRKKYKQYIKDNVDKEDRFSDNSKTITYDPIWMINKKGVFDFITKIVIKSDKVRELRQVLKSEDDLTIKLAESNSVPNNIIEYTKNNFHKVKDEFITKRENWDSNKDCCIILKDAYKGYKKYCEDNLLQPVLYSKFVVFVGKIGFYVNKLETVYFGWTDNIKSKLIGSVVNGYTLDLNHLNEVTKEIKRKEDEKYILNMTEDEVPVIRGVFFNCRYNTKDTVELFEPDMADLTYITTDSLREFLNTKTSDTEFLNMAGEGSITAKRKGDNKVLLPLSQAVKIVNKIDKNKVFVLLYGIANYKNIDRNKLDNITHTDSEYLFRGDYSEKGVKKRALYFFDKGSGRMYVALASLFKMVNADPKSDKAIEEVKRLHDKNLIQYVMIDGLKTQFVSLITATSILHNLNSDGKWLAKYLVGLDLTMADIARVAKVKEDEANVVTKKNADAAIRKREVKEAKDKYNRSEGVKEFISKKITKLSAPDTKEKEVKGWSQYEKYAVTYRKLYNMYKDWCYEESKTIIDANAFKEALEKAGFKIKSTGKIRLTNGKYKSARNIICGVRVEGRTIAEPDSNELKNKDSDEIVEQFTNETIDNLTKPDEEDKDVTGWRIMNKYTVGADMLYTKYGQWCKKNRIKIIGKKAFFETLMRLGFDYNQSSYVSAGSGGAKVNHIILGARLKSDVPADNSNKEGDGE